MPLTTFGADRAAASLGEIWEDSDTRPDEKCKVSLCEPLCHSQSQVSLSLCRQWHNQCLAANPVPVLCVLRYDHLSPRAQALASFIFLWRPGTIVAHNRSNALKRRADFITAVFYVN